MADEIRYVAELPGMVSVFMRPNPAVDWRQFNDPVYDPIWPAAEDTGLPDRVPPVPRARPSRRVPGLKLARVHNADGSYVPLEEFDAATGSRRGNILPNIYFTQAIANPVDVMSSICYITVGRRRASVPRHEVHVPRGQRRMAGAMARTARPPRQEVPWDVPWLEMLPSEYFRRQCWISFDPDETMLAFTANSPLCGADRIIWASDYPHPDANFPGVTDELAEALADLTFEQKKAITSESALALYGIT